MRNPVASTAPSARRHRSLDLPGDVGGGVAAPPPPDDLGQQRGDSEEGDDEADEAPTRAGAGHACGAERLGRGRRRSARRIGVVALLALGGEGGSRRRRWPVTLGARPRCGGASSCAAGSPGVRLGARGAAARRRLERHPAEAVEPDLRPGVGVLAEHRARAVGLVEAGGEADGHACRHVRATGPSPRTCRRTARSSPTRWRRNASMAVLPCPAGRRGCTRTRCGTSSAA